MPDRQGVDHGYVLGVDLGTTYSAAAIARGSVVEPCVLGTIAAQIPTVVVHRADSEVLTGEAAERRAGSEPTRTAREFKRRLGDPIPIIVGGTPYGAEALMAEMLEAIVGHASEREGEAPTTIVLTHPANYSEYKRGLLREAAQLAGLDLERVRLITEPEAAAIAYHHQQRIGVGEIIAVYDFGGGTFDAAVVRHTVSGFELLGTPEGMERLGGIDFDQAVLAHVDSALDGLVSSADAADPLVLAGQARLRDDCRRAKEALSSDTDAAIPVAVPGVQTEVRLTRDELEQMVRQRIVDTVRALQRTIVSAGLTTEDVSRVLLVGGSSRMPIVAQVVREMIGRPVSIDADPKLSIAAGAALSAAPTPAPTTVPTQSPEPSPSSAAVHAESNHDRNRAARPARAPTWSVRRRVGVAVAVAAVAAAAAAVIVSRNDEPTAVTDPPVTTIDLPSAPPVTQGAVDTALGTVRSTTGEITRLAFNGAVDGLGIPGPALQAGAPAALGAVAVALNGDVYVLAGSSVVQISGGEATIAFELSPSESPAGGITVGSDGAVFVATPAGIVRRADNVSEIILDGLSAGLSNDLGPLALDGGGNLYVADNGRPRIVRVAPDGALTLVAGTGTPAHAGAAPQDGAVAATAEIGRVTGLVVDRAGNLLIADAGLGLVLKVAGDGTITTAAIGVSFASVDGVAVAGDGSIYVADAGAGSIVRVRTGDGVESVFAAGRSTSVSAIALTPSGDIVFSDGKVLSSVVVGDSG
jgi:molecular chaperone DnaK